MNKEVVLLSRWTEESLDAFLREASGIRDSGERIVFLSRQFLGIDYRESTLAGNSVTPEALVINLEAVDCFTFIDYIEAMRLSASFPEFKENVKRVRYRSGKISFKTRNHFFTDWMEFNADLIDDVTGAVGGERVEAVLKYLNRREDGTRFLQGIAPRQREIRFIPSTVVDGAVLERLKAGDYIGIYSSLEGLDVSHVGIFIRDGNKTCLRHASSSKESRKVIDQDFMSYIANKPGIIALRPK